MEAAPSQRPQGQDQRRTPPVGYLGLVLHAHLPFVRHPEHARHLEERWLYEALVECYLPLLDAFDRLAREGIPFALTMSITPPLAAMLDDALLRQRFSDHLGRMQALADREQRRLWGDARFAPIATFYADHFARVRDVWDRHDGDVLAGLRAHWDAGNLELITCSATHCYLPGLLPVRDAIRPQLELGVRGFERILGRRPTGAWLAECAYHPDFDEEIARAGIGFTLVDTHGITHAKPRPPLGVHAPIASPSGVAFFGRDRESSEQVWSREQGYPGDAYYRDFYRDIGFDLPVSDLMNEVAADGSRLMTGLKYFRITGKEVDKLPYQPGIAMARASDHAADFVANRVSQVMHLRGTLGAPPIVVAPYDAELYGHWWFEGPLFLEGVFRALVHAPEVRAVTLRQYLDENPVTTLATPGASSWGAGGYGAVWVGHEAAWTWRHVHHATRLALGVLARHRGADGRRGQAVDQMLREVLLLQSSDWAFILKTGTSMGYADARVRAHVNRLRRLARLIDSHDPTSEDVAWVDDVCQRDNFLWQLPSEELRSAFS